MIERENPDIVFIHHLPAVTDVRFEVVCAGGYVRLENNTGSVVAYKRRDDTYSFDPLDLPDSTPTSATLELVRDLVHLPLLNRGMYIPSH